MNAYAEGKDDHWGKYTTRAKMPRYFPWTLGFVEQLLELEANGIISREYWGSVIGDHFGVPRFLEFNSMVNLALMQVNNRRSRKVDLNLEEWNKLINYFSSIRPDIYDFWFEFTELVNFKYMSKPSKKNRRVLGIKSKALQPNWSDRINRHPFEAFKKISINDWQMYSFPYSNFAIPKGDSTLLNRAVELVPPKNKFILHDTSNEKLLENIAQMNAPEVHKSVNFNDASFFHHLARGVKASGIWVPKVLKNYGKKFLN
jgi:hypothetical protein